MRTGLRRPVMAFRDPPAGGRRHFRRTCRRGRRILGALVGREDARSFGRCVARLRGPCNAGQLCLVPRRIYVERAKTLLTVAITRSRSVAKISWPAPLTATKRPSGLKAASARCEASSWPTTLLQ